MTRSSRWGAAPEAAAALVGVAWFLVLGGWRALDPTDLDWLSGDQRQQVLSWLFFRRAEWSLPLGRVADFAWPIGTTVGFTDGNPLVAIPLKPLQALLPVDFQFSGAWLAACFALQGWFGARVASVASPSVAGRILGGALFALAPPLAARVGHMSLCAHFALVALVWLHLRPLASADPARDVRRSLLLALALSCALAAVHPVLAAMVLALSLALVVRHARVDGALPRRAAWRWAGALFAGQAAVWLALGYFTSAPSHSWGFGRFSADLLTFVNPMGHSRFVPTLPAGPLQWEGFGYLGLGGLALVAVALALATTRRFAPGPGWRRAAPLAVVALLLFAFALSQKVTIAGRPLLDLTVPYRPLYPLVGPFRSSGRFVWPLWYLVLGGAVFVVLRAGAGRRWPLAVLAAALALQAADLSALAGRFFERRPWRLAAPEWKLAAGEYDHLALYPPQIVGTNGACAGEVYPDLHGYAPYAYEAYALGMTVNSAFLSRASTRRHDPPCVELDREVAAGVLRARTIYVVDASAEARFARPEAACGRLDARLVCVAAGAEGRFRRALEATALAR